MSSKGQIINETIDKMVYQIENFLSLQDNFTLVNRNFEKL